MLGLAPTSQILGIPLVYQSYSLDLFDASDTTTGQKLWCWRYQLAAQGLSLQSLRESWRMAQEIDHPCVARAVMVEKLAGNTLSVYTAVPMKPLRDLIGSSAGTPWNPEELMAHLNDLFAVLAAGQKLGLAHRQLTMDKVYAGKGGFQVCDLPPQAVSVDEERCLARDLHFNYLSPERAQLLCGESPQDYCPFRADVFSLGIVTLGIVFNHAAEDLPHEEVPLMLEELVQYPYCHSLLQAMLAPDARQRPSFLELVPEIPPQVSFRCSSCGAKAPISRLKFGKVYCGDACLPRSKREQQSAETRKKLVTACSPKLEVCPCGQPFKLKLEVAKKLCFTCQQRGETTTQPQLAEAERRSTGAAERAESGSYAAKQDVRTEVGPEQSRLAAPPKPSDPSVLSPRKFAVPAQSSFPASVQSVPTSPSSQLAQTTKRCPVCGKPGDLTWSLPCKAESSDSGDRLSFCSEACLKTQLKPEELKEKSEPQKEAEKLCSEQYSLPSRDSSQREHLCNSDLPPNLDLSRIGSAAQKKPDGPKHGKIGGGIQRPILKPPLPRPGPREGELQPAGSKRTISFAGVTDSFGGERFEGAPRGGDGLLFSGGEGSGARREIPPLRNPEGPYFDEKELGKGGPGREVGQLGAGSGEINPPGGVQGGERVRSKPARRIMKCCVCLENFEQGGQPLPGHEALTEICGDACQQKYIEQQDKFTAESSPCCLNCMGQGSRSPVILPCCPDRQFCGKACACEYIENTLCRGADLEFLTCPVCDTPIPCEVSAFWLQSDLPADPPKPQVKRGLQYEVKAPKQCCKCKNRAELREMKCGHGLCQICFEMNKQRSGFVDCSECGLRMSLKDG